MYPLLAEFDWSSLINGNTPILLILVFLLFKDKIFPPKPATPATTVPVQVPVTTPAVPAVPDRPLIDAIIQQVLPALLPMVVKLIQDQVKAEKEAGK